MFISFTPVDSEGFFGMLATLEFGFGFGFVLSQITMDILES